MALRSSVTRYGLIAVLLFTAFIGSVQAITPADIAGDWNGTLNSGSQSLRLMVHVTADPAGKLGASLDSLDQGAMGIPGDDVVLKGNAFSFSVPSVHGSYQGTVSADGKTIDGTWTQGTPLPLTLTHTAAAVSPTPEPTPTPRPARSPVSLRDLKTVLDQELAPALKDGLLTKSSNGGMVIGVLDHGERRIFVYGTARPDSIFEIGSITKTFTGLILAQMVVQKRVTLDDPVRSLLPQGFAGNTAASEITLLDLATQHSGLPRLPDNMEPEDPSNPYADYDNARLSAFIAKQGLAKPNQPKFLYSNLGFGLLGVALANRAGMSYAQLLQEEITGPLQMHDTAVVLSPEQKKRLIQGYDIAFNKAGVWDLGALAGAGAIKSTADDMLTYLEANLHPDRYAAGAAPGSTAATWPAAIAIDHQPRAEVEKGDKIALAWFIDPKTHTLDHNGGTGGYASFARFSPDKDWGVIALSNRSSGFPRFVDRVGQNVGELLSGEPSTPLDFMTTSDRDALAHPAFDASSIQGPYYCRTTAFGLPAKATDAFTSVSSGELHVVADGKGRFTRGTWEHRIPSLNLTCKLQLGFGKYNVKPDGTGSEEFKWNLLKEQSPRACVPIFAPKNLVTTDPQQITMDKTGRVFYSTSLNPLSVLNTVCEREEK